MTTLAQSTRHPLRQRRPLFLLTIAAVIFAGSLGYRYINDAMQESAAEPPVAAISAASVAAAEQMQLRLQRNPNDIAAYAQLGLGLLQQVRESGDTTLYGRAQKALDEAIKRDGQHIDALVGQGVLALALHDFTAALDWADKAWALNPFRAEILGIKVDGLVELGRYDEAVETLQKMVDLRPDMNSYSRISYVRELNGDVDGAIEAMSMAVESTPVGTESWLWTLTHLGHLYFNKGDLTAAESIYGQVLQMSSDYAYAHAGLARIESSRGETDKAIERLQPVAERMPLPEFLTLLGELYEITDDKKLANEQYELVDVIQQLNADAGMNVDLELALFNANHSKDTANTVKQARAAYSERPTIYAADALAWALYKDGKFEEAHKYSAESLKLTTRDAMLHFHAGMIAAALGNKEAAKTSLQTALEINPNFSLLYASEAKEMLAKMGG